MKIVLVAIVLSLSQFIFAHDQIDRILAQYTDTQQFIVADKEQGKIFIVDPLTKELNEASALYGKMKADKVNMSYYDRKNSAPPYVTPAGVYSIKRMYSTELKRNIMVFYEGEHILMAIHSVWLGNPVQKRDERLLSADPADHRITNGCINVPVDYFNGPLFSLPEHTKLYILPETIATKKSWEATIQQ